MDLNSQYGSFHDFLVNKGKPMRHFFGPEYDNASSFYQPFGGSTAVNALDFYVGKHDKLKNVSLPNSYNILVIFYSTKSI